MRTNLVLSWSTWHKFGHNSGERKVSVYFRPPVFLFNECIVDRSKRSLVVDLAISIGTVVAIILISFGLWWLWKYK